VSDERWQVMVWTVRLVVVVLLVLVLIS